MVSLEEKNLKLSASSSSSASKLIVMIKSTGVGLLFGFMLEKSKVYDPQIILDQMVFKRFIMIKMFFSALTASTLVVLFYRSRFPKAYQQIFEILNEQLRQRSMFTLIVGGLVLGFGMAVGGSCPGMLFIQLGAGVSNALVGVAGGVAGAWVHGTFVSTLNTIQLPGPKSSATIYDLLECKPKSFHMVLAAALLGTASLIELVFPWRDDFHIGSDENSLGLRAKIWPPIFAGLLLGSLQLFSFVLLKRPLGNSPPFTIAACHLVSAETVESNAYFKKWKHGNWERVALAVGALVGSFVSSQLGGVYGMTPGVSVWSAFAGGFMLVFGARLADGCNTGHGISGTANAFFGSAIATCAMFGGAMGLSLFL